MVDFPLPNEARIEGLSMRVLRAFNKARIFPSIDLGHWGLMHAATMLEERVTRDQFLELAAWWWDLVVSVESPVPPEARSPLPESAPVPLDVLEDSTRRLGKVIAESMPKGAGFVLVLFDFVANGSMTYVSSGERPSTIAMLKELLGKIQEGAN